jgi:UDP-glucose 4-epimerase
VIELKLLITGGAGFIGSHIALNLFETKNKITIIDDFSTGNSTYLHNYEIIKCDINNIDLLKKKLKGRQFDFLIHLASKSIVSESFLNEKEYMNTNVSGTESILNLCLFLNIKKVIFSSTASVYGFTGNKKIKETSYISPINPYGKSKLKAENILKNYSFKYNIDVITFRFFNACGGDIYSRIGELHNPETHLIPLLMQHILKEKKEKFNIYGNKFNTNDGYAIRDYLHVLDICKAVDLGVKWLKNNNGYQTINLGSGKATSVIEVTKSFQKYFNKKINIIIKNKRNGEPDFLLANIEKANILLDWHPTQSSLEKIIDDTYKWQLKLMREDYFDR